jgi:ABC-type uncharacterized transport system permease subunit
MQHDLAQACIFEHLLPLVVVGVRVQRLTGRAGEYPVRLTERTLQAIVAYLVAAGYLTRTRIGRRSRYTVNCGSLLRDAALDGHRVGPLALLAGGEDAGAAGASWEWSRDE